MGQSPTSAGAPDTGAWGSATPLMTGVGFDEHDGFGDDAYSFAAGIGSRAVYCVCVGFALDAHNRDRELLKRFLCDSSDAFVAGAAVKAFHDAAKLFVDEQKRYIDELGAVVRLDENRRNCFTLGRLDGRIHG